MPPPHTQTHTHTDHHPRKNTTYVEDVKLMSCMTDAFNYAIPWTHWDQPYQRQQHQPSALIWCLIIDCGQLVKSSSCLGGLQGLQFQGYCTAPLFIHRIDRGNWLPCPQLLVCFPVCNSFCCGSASKSEVRAITLGDSERRKAAVHFHVKRKKITTRNCFM